MPPIYDHPTVFNTSKTDTTLPRILILIQQLFCLQFTPTQSLERIPQDIMPRAPLSIYVPIEYVGPWLDSLLAAEIRSSLRGPNLNPATHLGTRPCQHAYQGNMRQQSRPQLLPPNASKPFDFLISLVEINDARCASRCVSSTTSLAGSFGIKPAARSLSNASIIHTLQVKGKPHFGSVLPSAMTGVATRILWTEFRRYSWMSVAICSAATMVRNATTFSVLRSSKIHLFSSFLLVTW